MDTASLAPEDKIGRGGRGEGSGVLEGEVIQSLSDLKSLVILMIYETCNILKSQRRYLSSKQTDKKKTQQD